MFRIDALPDVVTKHISLGGKIKMKNSAFIDELIERLSQSKEEGAYERYFTKYLGEEISTAVEAYQQYETSLMLVAIDNLIKDKYEVHETFAVDQFDMDEENPPQFVYIQINENGDKVRALCCGSYQLTNKEGKKLIVEVDTSEKIPNFVVYTSEGNEALAKEFIQDVRTYFNNNNFYKGKVVSFLGSGFMEFFDIANKTWDDIIISDEIKEELTHNVFWPIEKTELYNKHGISSKRGVMLEGPPGTGKSLAVSVIANYMRGTATVIVVTSKSISRVDDISNIYAAAKAMAPSIVVFEDIDLIALDRVSFGNNSPLVGELLAQLDGLDSKSQVITIATTNYPENIDVALSKRPSRFDRRIKFDNPDEEARLKMLNKFVDKLKLHEDVDLRKIAKEATDMSGAFIKEIVVTAVIESLKDNTEQDIITLRHKHLETALHKFKEMPQAFGFISREE